MVVPVAVNGAPEQRREPSLVETVTRSLARHGVPPDTLVLGVTEQGVIADEAGAHEVLTILRGMGVRTARDDFGTGFSSLSHLARLPVDAIKVDRQFVAGTLSAHRAIVCAVATLGQALDLEGVAEGIETTAHAASARRRRLHPQPRLAVRAPPRRRRRAQTPRRRPPAEDQQPAPSEPLPAAGRPVLERPGPGVDDTADAGGADEVSGSNPFGRTTRAPAISRVPCEPAVVRVDGRPGHLERHRMTRLRVVAIDDASGCCRARFLGLRRTRKLLVRDPGGVVVL